MTPKNANGSNGANGRRDPSPNVNALVDAGMQRQDDLREMEAGFLQRMGFMAIIAASALGGISMHFGNMLRKAEAKRIDAIRSVDVAAVKQANDTANLAAIALQGTVTTSAETLRKQVETTAMTAGTQLDARLQPIQKDIADLRRDQYAQQGAKSATTEKEDSGRYTITTIIAVAAIVSAAIISIGVAVVMYFVTHPGHP